MLDCDDAIDVTTSSADADASKPAPDIVSVALDKAAWTAADALFVGDAVWDVAGRRQARGGLHRIGERRHQRGRAARGRRVRDLLRTPAGSATTQRGLAVDMTNFGYTLMTEQSGPKELVGYAVGAEQAGFDFAVSSDHYFPWLTEMGHARLRLVRARRGRPGDRAGGADDLRDLPDHALPPGGRRPEGGHPGAAVGQPVHPRPRVAGRTSTSTWSARGWPIASVRQDMLLEAIEIIKALHKGEQTTWVGEHFRVDSAKIWDLPSRAGADRRSRSRARRRSTGSPRSPTT